jgi:hypothetical protein
MGAVRESFYTKIITDAKKSHSDSTLDFPINLYWKNRITICKELYERFDRAEIEVIRDDAFHGVLYPVIKGFFDDDKLKAFSLVLKIKILLLTK